MTAKHITTRQGEYLKQYHRKYEVQYYYMSMCRSKVHTGKKARGKK